MIGNIEKKKGKRGSKPSAKDGEEEGDKMEDVTEEKEGEGEKEEKVPETGGWKGEEREARMYLFELDDGKVQNAPKPKKKSQPGKIKRGGGLKDADSSDSE